MVNEVSLKSLQLGHAFEAKIAIIINFILDLNAKNLYDWHCMVNLQFLSAMWNLPL